MSPKKKRKGKARRAGGAGAALQNRSSESPGPPVRERRPEPPERPKATAADRPARRRREPIVIDGAPARWPVWLWVALTAVWIGGSAMFLVFFLAEGWDMVGAEEVTPEARRATAWYLLGLVGCAWLVPLAGVLAAWRLRRKVAAGMFAAALVLSLLALGLVGATPWEAATTVWAGLRA